MKNYSIPIIGTHVSIANGLHNTILNANKLNIQAFSMFLKSPRVWTYNKLNINEINKFKHFISIYKFKVKNILPHASYMINLGNPNNIKRQRSVSSLINEIEICNSLGLKFINIHPGNHLNLISEKQCLYLITDSLIKILLNSSNIIILLENTAGQGTCVGYNFDHLAQIINILDNNLKSRIGICIDTCHAFAAGYELNNLKQYEQIISEFDKKIGLKYLKGIHLNDSKDKLSRTTANR